MKNIGRRRVPVTENAILPLFVIFAVNSLAKPKNHEACTGFGFFTTCHRKVRKTEELLLLTYLFFTIYLLC
ncbi:MAG: hypothetical protein LBU85_00600, partial [Treponema sp.]|nr:hypothetical protein [Treponema sp.]